MILLSILAVGCNEPPAARGVVELRVGNAPDQHKNFEADTSLAEYLEIPGSGNELRLLIASHEVSCDVFEPPSAEDVSVSVVITTPTGIKPTPGVYPWLGHDAHGGEVKKPVKPYAFPTARIGGKSYVFQAGGGAVLKELTLGKHGSVTGLLNFEFAGDAKQPATLLKGRFSARICRYSIGETS